MLNYYSKETIYICLAVLLAAFLFQWHAEAQYNFKIINASATTDKNNYNRTEIIKINYSLFCMGNGENQKMQLKLNKSFDFSQEFPPFYKKSMNQYCSKEPSFIGPYKRTLEAKLCNGPNKPTIAVILCNITSNANCPVSTFDLTSDKFLYLYDRGDNNELRIPANITIKDNPPIISNFRGNTSSVNNGDILKFDFLLSDKDSENISYSLVLNKNDSIIYHINNSTRIQFNCIEPVSLNYNTSMMTPEDYVFRIFAKSNEGGYAWSDPFNVTISNKFQNSKLEFAFFVLVIIALFYFVSKKENDPIMGVIKSIIISIPIIVVHSIFIGREYILLLLIILISSIPTNYALSRLEKKPISDTNSIIDEFCPTPAIAKRIIALFNLALTSFWTSINIILMRKTNIRMEKNQDIPNAKNEALIISSIWMFLIMEIIICHSPEKYVQTKFDFSIIGSIFLALFLAFGVFYALRNCSTLYVALLIISCTIWLCSLVYISSNLYVRDFFEVDSAAYIVINVLLSLAFLPFFTYYYFAWKRHKSRAKNG